MGFEAATIAMLGAMSEESGSAASDPKTSVQSAGADAERPALEPGPAPTPFDHPLFLPAVCIGFTVWFGYDTYIHPMEEHLDFNYYGFKVVLAASAWYGYLAFCEIQAKRPRAWVLPTIFAALAAWLGAEAFGVIELPKLVEYPAISEWAFRLSAVMVPVSALREWLRGRSRPASDAAA